MSVPRLCTENSLFYYTMKSVVVSAEYWVVHLVAFSDIKVKIQTEKEWVKGG